MADKTIVLILGGGFGGLYAALELEKRNDPRFKVTIVNRENFFLVTPMLHEIAASDLNLTNIVNPVRKMIRRVNFFCGEVEQKRFSVNFGAAALRPTESSQNEHNH
jgi:NADH dehydrogenase